MKKILVRNLLELRELADAVAARLQSLPVRNSAIVVTLSGDLGAGKTAFMQQLGQVLGIEEKMPSPTYVIFKSYPLRGERFTELIHMDAYRIEEVRELIPLQFSELLERPDVLVCIEWPERIATALPSSCLALTFRLLEGEVREVVIADTLG